ncbi:MAG: tetratricopeptide repeat protein [Bacteroidota bacterium]
MKRSFLFPLLLLCCYFSISAGPFPNAMIESSLEKFYLDQAEKQLEGLSHPGHQQFYQTHIWLYRFLATQDSGYADSVRTHWRKTVGAVEDLPDDYPLKNVMLAELHGKRAALEFLNGKYWAAVLHTRACRNLAQRNQKHFPENNEQYKILGLFNIIFGSVPKKYRWLAKILGYSGNVDMGMEQLEKAAETSVLLKFEAQLILFYVEKNLFSEDTRALKRIEVATEKQGPGIVTDFLIACSLEALKKNEAAIQLLQKRNLYKNDPRVFFISDWDYHLGRVYYFKEDYKRAKIYFSKFLREHKGSFYRTDAAFRLGMALSLSGSYDQGRLLFRRVEKEPPALFNEDEYAAFMAKQFAKKAPTLSESLLFRARNLYDGGYYDRAIQRLSQLPVEDSLSAGDRTEMHYRYGRIKHSQGELTEAIEHYQASLKMATLHQKWMQAYACYYMGNIARQRKNKVEARVYYQKALAYDDYFYQDGLENRTKTALSSLKK